MIHQIMKLESCRVVADKEEDVWETPLLKKRIINVFRVGTIRKGDKMLGIWDVVLYGSVLPLINKEN